MAADPTSSFKLPYLGGSGSSLGWSFPMAVTIEPIMDNWAFSDVNIEKILHDYRQNPDAFIPEFVALEDLAQIYLNNPGFHANFQDFMDEWQEEDNAVECEF